MTWVVSLAVTGNVEQQRGKHKLWDISHWAFPARAKCCLFIPKDDSTGDRLRKEHGRYGVAVPRKRFQILPTPETD